MATATSPCRNLLQRSNVTTLHPPFLPVTLPRFALAESVVSLAGRAIIVTGASRGLGRAIAMRCAREGARVGLIARSGDTPHHASLTGTLQEVYHSVREAGGEALVMPADVSDGRHVKYEVDRFINRFGAIDAVVNNASMLALEKHPPVTTCDKIVNVNVVGAWNVVSAAHRALSKSVHGGHVVSISPPLETLAMRWLTPHPMYSASKYAMTMCTLGLSDEFYANTVWPRKLLRTAATRRIEREMGLPAHSQGWSPDTFADAVHTLLTTQETGRCYFDDELVSYADEEGGGVDDIFV